MMFSAKTPALFLPGYFSHMKDFKPTIKDVTRECLIIMCIYLSHFSLVMIKHHEEATDGRESFSIWFQRHQGPSWWESVAASRRHDRWSRNYRINIFNHKHQADSELEKTCYCKTPYFLHQHTSKPTQTAPATGD